MRFRKPFYRESRRLWYVQLDGRQINLGSDEKEAWRRYHEMMADRGQEVPVAPVDTSLAVVILDQFLEWVERRKSQRTYEWYKRHLLNFSDAIPHTLAVDQLKPHHVTAICDKRDWSPTTKHGFCRAVQRAFRWAARQGLIARTPIADVEKPEPQDREVVIAPDQYEQILGMVKGGFRELLMMAWESGMRPQEIRVIEARHIDRDNGRIILPRKEAKGKKLPRVIYLTDEAMEIANRQVEAWPTGPIFRNSDGKPWTRYAINCAFIRLQIAFGREEMKREGIAVPKLPRFKKSKVSGSELSARREEQKAKLAERRKEITRMALERGKKLHLGAFRKSWATEALKNGVDVITASHLLGHTNPAMLAKVYAKVQADPDFMRRQAKKAKGES